MSGGTEHPISVLSRSLALVVVALCFHPMLCADVRNLDTLFRITPMFSGSAAPGEYNSGKFNPTPSTVLMKAQQSSAFKSQTLRMKQVPGADAPPPNSYYAAESHAALNATTGLRPGDAGKAFNTQQGRFDPATSTQREKLAVHANPVDPISVHEFTKKRSG